MHMAMNKVGAFVRSSLFHGTERTGTTPYNTEQTEIHGNVRARSMSTVLKVSACPLAISIAVELLQYPPEDSVSLHRWEGCVQEGYIYCTEFRALVSFTRTYIGHTFWSVYTSYESG